MMVTTVMNGLFYTIIYHLQKVKEKWVSQKRRKKRGYFQDDIPNLGEHATMTLINGEVIKQVKQAGGRKRMVWIYSLYRWG